MSPIRQKKRDLRRAADLSWEDIEAILELATEYKAALRRGIRTPALEGKSLAMIFEKPSLRTRATFEIGMVQLGGHAVYLSQQEIGLGQRESVRDVARNLERWFDLGVVRTFLQSTADELADHCRIPIINALTDEEHPCQALADFLTLREILGDLPGRTLAYIGDGNNICHSLMIIGARLGMNIRVASPKGYEPKASLAQQSREEATASGGSYQFHEDPVQAVLGADAIYTDVWTSMGQEEESEARREAFQGFQVNSALVEKAPENVLVMHDLPAHRGEEITDEVMDSHNCIVFDQAENRLHVQKGILAYLHNESE